MTEPIPARTSAAHSAGDELSGSAGQDKRLALSESRYRSLVQASAQIVWITGADGNQEQEPTGWAAFTGQTPEQASGFGWADAVHPEDRERSFQEWNRAVTSGTPLKLEQRLRRQDGVYRHMLVRGVPVRDDTGTIVEWLGTHVDITEQVVAEETLRQAHQRLENVLNGISDGLVLLDRDLRYTYVNRPGLKMLGMTGDQFLGKTLTEVFPHSTGTAFEAAFTQALATGQAIRFEEFYPQPLNKWLECDCSSTEAGLSVYFRDVTERRLHQHTLRASEERFRKLFESDLMGIGIPNRFGSFDEANDELLRIVGYTREDLKAGLVRWDTMTPPEYQALDAFHIAEAAERGSCTPYEKEYIRKDGLRVPILCGYALLENTQDTYIGFVQDLTPQKQAQQDLREREQRFSVLAESLPALIFVSEADGENSYCNGRFLDYAGYHAGQAAQVRWATLIHPDDLQETAAAWRQCRQDGDAFLKEHRLLRHDGVYRWFLSRAMPVKDDAGNILRWFGSSTEIHDQKLAEEALRRSEKLAVMGRLAASVAHEINNPLTSVTNTLYLALQDKTLSEETRGFLNLAEQELARVAQVATQTLRFYKQSTAPVLIDVTQIIEPVLMMFSSRLNGLGIEIEREYRGQATLYCFSDELRQVFANLISNALDAMTKGGRLKIRIRSATSPQPDRRRGLRILFSDTGVGIPRNVRHQIFEPFVSTKAETGTGLGLWVSAGIVRKHGGWISVRSSTDAVEHGTVFSLFLPQDGVPSAKPQTAHA